MGGACLVVLPTLRNLKPRYRATTTDADDSVLEQESQRLDAVAGGSSPLRR